MIPAVTRALRRLEALQAEFGPGTSEAKLRELAELSRARLGSAAAVARLHEVLCFLRAYPDDASVLECVEELLEGFERRADLRRHAHALADSGIAGTAITYPFFAEMARWLAARWPAALSVVWDEFESQERLEGFLQELLLFGESPGLDEWTFPMREWCARLKRPDESDAAFLVRRFAALPVGATLSEWLYQEMGLTLTLAPCPGTPSRTRARARRLPVVFQDRPLDRSRPDLARDVSRPPVSVRSVSRSEGAALIDLARAAMVTRGRDLDVFSYGNPDDVRLVDCGGGLMFAAIGALPERRLLLEAVYGFLTLKNGVPIGYVLNSALLGSAEVAYNVFDTYRGGEAAHVYGRVLATLRRLFGCDSFTVYPYQLGGDGNEEGLASGAWWFYQKLGFRARDAGVLRLMKRELKRLGRSPRARTSIATLRELAAHNVYWHLGAERDDVIGLAPLSKVGLALSDALAARWGSDREGAVRDCRREAAHLLGAGDLRGWSKGERLAWERWATLVVHLPGIARWPREARRKLLAVVRAKGGRRESDFVRRFDAHGLLRRALLRMTDGVEVEE
ncbi:MAG TPA: hypothetical protein VMT18_13320 [Planctomycetota bacterium]|nr:hypothetical protein [Planctomycetota bacterium]